MTTTDKIKIYHRLMTYLRNKQKALKMSDAEYMKEKEFITNTIQNIQ